MATVINQADDIRRQMADVRAQLHTEMRGVVDDVAAVTDWQGHIHKHPWLAIGAAFGIGYLLVPKRHAPPSVIIKPAEAQTLAAAVSEAPQAKRSSVWKWALGAVTPIVIRAAQSYAITQVEKLLAENPPGPHPAPAGLSQASGPGEARFANRRF